MTRPNLRDVVLVCLACHHWQIDVRPGAVSDLGGMVPAFHAVAEVAADHEREDCPGAGGRFRIEGKWVDAPKLPSGQAATGLLGAHPLPAWWVSK